MCIRLKKLRSHKHLGLLFCLALSAMTASYSGQSRSMAPSADTGGEVLRQAEASRVESQPITIALATDD